MSSGPREAGSTAVDELQPMHSPDQALALLLSRVAALPSEPVAVGPQLAGRVSAEAVRAAHDLPPFASSAMDGYALRAAEASAPLPLAGSAAAGDDPPALPAGAAMGIATGAPVPDGADAVVPVEQTREVDGRVVIEAAVTVGQHVRAAGDDARAGVIVVPAGVRLRPLAAAAVAACGLASVRCTRRPRVAVLVTGDELRPPGASLRRGQIYETNSLLIAGRCAALGAEVVAVERVPDRLDATTDAFQRALHAADVVLSSGGVSVGPHDHVKLALKACGVEQLFWRVAIQPGKPIWAGVTGEGRVAIGLPGNPLSVLAGLELFVAPALAALSGAAEPAPPRERRRLAAAVRRNPRRTRVLPAALEDGDARPLGAGLSHLLASAAAADALVIVPPGQGEEPVGAAVEVIRL